MSSNKDVEKLVLFYEEYLQNMTGVKIKFSKNDVRRAAERLKDMKDFFQKWNIRELQQLNQIERKKYFIQFIEECLRKSFSVPANKNPIELLVEAASAWFSPDDGFTKKTRFDDYKNTLFNIIENLGANNKIIIMKDFLKTIPADEIFTLSQHATRFNLSGHTKFLLIEHKRITEKVVDRYISIYDSLAGHMEKMVRVLYGAKKILEGESILYSQIQKFRTSNNVDSLRHSSLFKGVVIPFNVNVWNAIKHKSVMKMPNKKTLKFIDDTTTVVLQYDTFIQQTRELFATTYISAHFVHAVDLYVIQKILLSESTYHQRQK